MHRIARDRKGPVVAFAIAPLVLAMVSCGGGGGGGVGGGGGPEFEVLSGGSACGGECGGDSASGGVGGDADSAGAGGALSAMRNVVVVAYRPDGTELGRAPLVNNLVSLYRRTYTGAFLLRFQDDGSGTGEYFDEAKVAWIRLQGQALHVMVPALTHHLSANPLTEAAYQWAISQYGSESALTAERMTVANNTVRDQFNARLGGLQPEYRPTDITNFAVPITQGSTRNTLPATVAGRYGAVLASLPGAAANFDPTLAAPALAFTRQLAADIVDDSRVNSSAPVATPAYGPNFDRLIVPALRRVVEDFGAALPLPPGPANCFDPALLAVGNRQVLEYQSSGPNQPLQVSTDTIEVTRQTTFNGFTAREIVFTDSRVAGTRRDYFSPLGAEGITIYGFTVDNPTGSTVARSNPPYVDRRAVLAVGESFTMDITSEVTFTPTDGTPTTTRQTSRETVRFVGYETVTVPAGTFTNACRFDTVTTSGDSTITSTDWVTASGQDVAVRSSDSAGNVTELRSGTVNNSPVR